MENNNNPQGFNMEEYNNFLKSIKCGSPVHKINFTLESPNAVAGMYLITKGDNTVEYLNKIADKTDLNGNTLLVFESRHVIECCQIIYGMLNVLSGIAMYNLSYETFINEVIDTLLAKPSFYKTVINEITNIVDNLIRIDNTKESSLIFSNFLYIMRNIWFVPYGQIDEMAKEAIAEFEKHCEDGGIQ